MSKSPAGKLELPHIKQLRARNRQLKTHLENRMMERRTRLMEQAAPVAEYVGQFQEMIGEIVKQNNDFMSGGTPGRWQRTKGADWPIVKNETDLAMFRGQSRILCATNLTAQGLINGVLAYAVGPGGFSVRATSKRKNSPAPPDLLEAVEDVIKDFQKRNDWYGGEQPGMEAEFVERTMEDGEVILNLNEEEDGITDARYFEPEQLTQPKGASDQAEYTFGVLVDRKDAAKTRKYFVEYEDGKGDEYEPDEIIHFKNNVKRVVKRGMPDFCFDQYDTVTATAKIRGNLAETAAVQAAIAMVRKHVGADQSLAEDYGTGNSDYQIQNIVTGILMAVERYRPGRREDVGEGFEYGDPPSAANAPNHLLVYSELCKAAGRRYNAPSWLASGDSSDNSYANALAAGTPFVRNIQMRQTRFGNTFQRIYEKVIERRANAGKIRTVKRVWTWEDICALVDITVTPTTPISKSRLENAQANALEIPLGYQSPQKAAEEEGREYEQIAADLNKHAQEMGGGSPLDVKKEDDKPNPSPIPPDPTDPPGVQP